jgi:hypothetical protein
MKELKTHLVVLGLVVLPLGDPLLATEPYPIPTTGQETQRFIPAKLVEIALQRARAFRGKEHSWYLYAYIDAYLDYLLVRGNAYNRSTLEVQRQAFQHGIADARNGLTSATPEDFGYKRTRVEGRFVIEFEGSRFHPIGSKALTTAFAFRMGSDVSRDEIVEGHNYLVECWLSPERRSPVEGYGHMGMFSREIVVLSIVDSLPRASRENAS